MTSEQIRKQLLEIAALTDADLRDVIRMAKQILLDRKQARATKKYLQAESDRERAALDRLTQ